MTRMLAAVLKDFNALDLEQVPISEPTGDGPDVVWNGASAGYMLTTESCLFTKPPSLSFGAAALAEPLSGAWRVLIQYSELEVGEDVVVTGVGSIGLLCLMVAAAAGVGTPIVIAPTEHARNNALARATTPLAMSRAIRLMEKGNVDAEKIASRRYPLSKIQDAVETGGRPVRNKVVVNP